MNFNTDNKIDKQITEIFAQESLETLDPEDVEYFGISLSSDSESNNIYKIYYEGIPSKKVYSQNDKNPIIETLYNMNMLRTIRVVNDNSHKGFSKFDIMIKRETDEKIKKIFSFFEQNIPLFKKNKKEILKLSKMKLFDDDNYKYASFHSVGLVYDDNFENTLLKVYWSNYISAEEEIFDKNYYLKYLEDSNIPQFKILSEIAKNILNFCGGRIYMEGIDYTKEGAVSHKIYIKFSNLDGYKYNDLKKSVPENCQTLKNRIEELKKWNKLHSEIKLDGVAIGIDNHNNKNLKLYYKIQEEDKTELQPSEQILQERKLNKKITRFYPVKQFGFIRQINNKNS